MPNDDCKWQQTYLNTFHKAYRKHKKIREWTNQYIAETIDVDTSTAEKWSKGESAPQGGSMMALTELFGAEFASDMLAPLKMTGVYRINTEHVTVAELHSIVSRVTHVIADARADNDVCPQEDALIKHDLGGLIHCAVDYIANGNGRK